MKPQQKLVLVKSLHTVIWLIMVCIIGFVVWSGATAHVTVYSWLAVGVVVLEGVVLLLFKGRCPLTYIARKYSDATAENFDIYLPLWLAKYNKQIFTTIFIIGLVLMLLSYL